MERLKTLEEYLMELPKEQLVSTIIKSDKEKDKLRTKLFLITGCRDFGSANNGIIHCIGCYEKNRELHKRCVLFGNCVTEYFGDENAKNSSDLRF